MMSEDITFCSKSDCKNTKCERNPKNIKQEGFYHSYAMFTECKYYKESNNETDN
jgi:hypothetical protein